MPNRASLVPAGMLTWYCRNVVELTLPVTSIAGTRPFAEIGNAPATPDVTDQLADPCDPTICTDDCELLTATGLTAMGCAPSCSHPAR